MKFKTRPVPASGWFNTPMSPELRATALVNGIVPYNDPFEPLWNDDYNILLAFGGRGGGKSESVADKLIDECVNEEYFKCYYGRKVFENVRDSCFATLVYCIKKRGLQAFFRFSEADTSSMTITYIPNGNKFIAFGSDKADKLKSIKDPTHIWCEEFDQFNADDFKELYPALRTIRGRNIFYGTFNTYPVFTDHWLIGTFFPEMYTGLVKREPLPNARVCKIFINYTDNLFLDQEDYAERLLIACGMHLPTFNRVANGEWGVVENENPWLYSWDDSKHTLPDIPYFPQYPVILSFDFNNDPFACTAWQFSEHKGSAESSFIHCLKEFNGKIKIEEMCMQISSTFPGAIFYVTGDRSGQNEDLGRNQTLYQMIAALLNIKSKFLKLNNTNLEHVDSRVFLNAMLGNYPNLYISRKGCPQLIKQCAMATVDVKSNKPSQLLKDRGVYKMDEFDGFRYFFQTFFHEWAKSTYLRLLKK